ncbi:MAG: alpha/beta hydrolase [Oscillospiraceae bacterium]|nr:alpha/beta hydrolase [Oscillospiraceae bacterium]
MIHETISLPGMDGSCARLVSYVPDNFEEIDPDRTRPTVLICPGGAYLICSEREGEPVALMLAAHGFNAFVLYYRTGYGCRPKPQEDIAHAMAYLRGHAARYHIKSDSIAVMGFSAGGHLACSLGVLWHRQGFCERVGVTPEQICPNAMVLCYPVITAGEYAHRGSFWVYTNSENPEEHTEYSLEKLVDEHTPPAFLWHTMNDAVVPVENTLLLSRALSAQKIPAEVHIYPDGMHGLSLANHETTHPGEEYERLFNVPYCQNWIDHAIAWLKKTL